MKGKDDSATLLTPRGFQTNVANVGIKDTTEDFVCIFSTVPCVAAGVFTRSRFAGPSVQLNRAHIKDNSARAIVAISKNANVANGEQGLSDAREIIAGVGAALGVAKEDILIASTGIIGRRFPMEKILPHVQDLAANMAPADFPAAARGIMTTDLVPKLAAVRVGDCVLLGIAKGVGMMEPNMSTLLAFFMTDADVEAPMLDGLFRRVVDRTFNCLSIDTDTSTSDTAIILANGSAGRVDAKVFEAALDDVALRLVKAIARDGEGATKVLEVTVDQARDYAQAKRVAKAVVNSPLVKTAIHGCDPNWGRVAMAVGKCDGDFDIIPEKTRIAFGSLEVFPKSIGEQSLDRLKQLLRSNEVKIHVSLGIGESQATVWGCDLSAEYVRINGEYST